MHYELWGAHSANVIAVVETDAEGLALVRVLLSDGWNPRHLTQGLDFDEGEEGDDAMLPEVVYVAALAERGPAAAPGPVHTTVELSLSLLSFLVAAGPLRRGYAGRRARYAGVRRRPGRAGAQRSGDGRAHGSVWRRAAAPCQDP